MLWARRYLGDSIFGNPASCKRSAFIRQPEGKGASAGRLVLQLTCATGAR
jgi:hypothetical protein